MMTKENPQLEALKHELGNCINIGETQLEDIQQAYQNFKEEPSTKLAIGLQTMTRAWINTRQRYELLHKIYSHGWNEDGTRFE